MRSRWLWSVVIVAGAAALFVRAPKLSAGQGAAAYNPPKTTDGKPDLQGIWQVHNRAGVSLLDHDPIAGMIAGPGKPFPMYGGGPAGRSVVEGGVIPYLPAAAAKQKENFANHVTLDPVSKCYMPGLPRAMYMNLAFQIFQTPKYIAVVYEYSHTYRIIYTDGTPHIEGIDFWMGDSRGHWEGNTLVVDVKDLNDQTWFDMSGNFHSDALHLVERYTLTSADVLDYQVTIEDPKVFSRPWKISMPIYRQTARDYGDRLLEYECADLAEEAAGTFYVGNHVEK